MGAGWRGDPGENKASGLGQVVSSFLGCSFLFFVLLKYYVTLLFLVMPACLFDFANMLLHVVLFFVRLALP